MEDQAEKMEALKKAYAEIILNTAKEAAARAMASECKALRFHHDLRHTKDEALQMLLRFKNMIDSATTEAGKTSMSQQKRIDELDAQLNETEVVILDLRAELRNAHARLEEAKNSHSHSHMDNSETTPIKKNPDTNEHFIPSSECSKSFNPAKENSFFINTNPKEPELYRNGYTHRIRAIERNLVDEKSIISDDNNETSTKNKDQILEENQNSGCSLRRSIRKRKVRCWDEISSLFKSHKKYSDNDDVEFDDNYKSKALSEVNQTIVPISTSINASDSEANKCEEKDVETDSVVSGCGGTNDKNRVLKYTFSRKRKKGLLTKSDNDKSNLKEEASSDSQNMIEVACQLISLRRVML